MNELVSSGTTVSRDQELRDVLTIIADFLERSTPLQETAATLRSEVCRQNLLLPSINWDGCVIPGRLPDFRSMRKTPRDHLISTLRIQSRDFKSSSLLQNSFAAAAAIEKAAAERRKNEASTSSKIKRLIDLKKEQRQLARELASGRGRSSLALSPILDSNKIEIIELVHMLRSVPKMRKESNCNIIDSLALRKNPESMMEDHCIWKTILSRYRVLKKIYGHRAPAYCVMMSETSKWIFTGADDGNVKVWNAQNGQLHSCFRGHRNVITEICNNDEWIASGSEDNGVRIFEIGTSRPVIVLTQHLRAVQRVEFSHDGSKLFSSAEDGTCCVWNMDSIRSQIRDRDITLEAYLARERDRLRHERLNQMQHHGEGAQIPFNQEQEDIDLLLKFPSPAILVEQPLVFPHVDNHGNIVPIVCMAVHPSGKYVATGSEDSLGRIWAVDEVVSFSAATAPGLINGNYVDGGDHLMCTLSGHTVGFVDHIEWSNSGDKVLTFSMKDGTARIWFWPHGPFDSKPHHIALKAVMATSNGNPVTSKSKQIPMINAAGFSKNDQYVVTTQSVKPLTYETEDKQFFDSRVCVWDAKTGTLLRFMRGHRKAAAIIRMHPELPWVAVTCGKDALIIVWDIEAGEEITRLSAISPEGYPEILDARWSKASNHSCDLVATDSLGRLLLIGLGKSDDPKEPESADIFDAAPCEQFFAIERKDLVWHQVTDESLIAGIQIPLYLSKNELVDIEDVSYQYQPPPIKVGEGSYYPYTTPFSSHEQRVKQAQERQNRITRDEKRKELDEKEIVDKQDALINEARARDKQELANAATGVTNVRKSAPARKRQAPLLALERAAVEEDTDDEEEEPESPQNAGGRARRAAARRATAQIHRHVRTLGDSEVSRQEMNDTTYVSRTPRSTGDQFVVDEEEEDDEDDDEEELSLSDSYDESPVEDLDDDEIDVPKRRSSRSTRTRLPQEVFETEMPEMHEILRRERVREKKKKSTSVHVESHSTNGFSDEWLTYATNTSCFIPQKHDLVTYFPQGHAEYLYNFPSTDSPPWQAWNVHVWVYVVCRVLNIEHVFPSQTELRHVVCKLTLQVELVKSLSSPAEPYRSHLPPIIFTVNYHSFEIEYLVLFERFLAGLRIPFISRRIHFQLQDIENPLEPASYFGTATEIGVKDMSWPDSPWEAVGCQLDDDAGQVSKSPWDLELLDDNNNLVANPRIAVGPQVELFFSLKVGDKPFGEWMANEIDCCPLWYIFLRVQRDSNLPSFITISLVCERLRNGRFYRQWESVEDDFDKVIESMTFGKPENHPLRKKAKIFHEELMDILNYARYGLSYGAINSSSSSVTISSKSLKFVVIECLKQCATVDREGYFANPVDANELTDYYTVISHPMDFSTIHTRVQQQTMQDQVSLQEARRFVRSVIADVRLISSNALQYNLEGSLVVRRAKELLKKTSQTFATLDYGNLPVPPQEEERVTSTGRRVRTHVVNYQDAKNSDSPDSVLDSEDKLDSLDEMEEESEEDDDFAEDDEDDEEGASSKRHSKRVGRSIISKEPSDNNIRRRSTRNVESQAEQRIVQTDNSIPPTDEISEGATNDFNKFGRRSTRRGRRSEENADETEENVNTLEAQPSTRSSRRFEEEEEMSRRQTRSSRRPESSQVSGWRESFSEEIEDEPNQQKMRAKSNEPSRKKKKKYDSEEDDDYDANDVDDDEVLPKKTRQTRRSTDGEDDPPKRNRQARKNLDDVNYAMPTKRTRQSRNIEDDSEEEEGEEVLPPRRSRFRS